MRVGSKLVFVLLAAALAGQQGQNGTAVWKLLAERHDADRDGRITAAEYGRGAEKFAALDRDGDGALTAADFERNAPAGRRPGGGGRGGEAAREARALQILEADADRDGRLTRGELEARFQALDKDGDGRITPPPDGARPLLRLADQDGDGALTLVELRALFAAADGDGDERVDLGAPPLFEGRPPKVGERAPDFELATASDRERRVKLSSFAGKRPVALIFGSYT